MEFNSVYELEPEIKDYIDFLNSADKSGVNVYTAERVVEKFDVYYEALNTFILYPDIFLDLIIPSKSYFKLYPFQRIILREMMRCKQLYFTACRATGKSFLAFLSRQLTAMFLPGHKTAFAADGKDQVARIAQEKTADTFGKFPLLAREMIKHRRNGRIITPHKESKGEVTLTYTHAGTLDVVGMGPKTRGARRHSLVAEEVITIDPILLNEVIIPLVNVSRKTVLGEENPTEPHAAQLYVTSAGYVGTFAHDKVLETLCLAVLQPDKYAYYGTDFQLPVLHGLISPEEIKKNRGSSAFGVGSFEREYGSVWSSDAKGSPVDPNRIKKQRILKNAEFKAVEKPGLFYAMGADMAKDGDARTVVTITKVQARGEMFSYKLVNLYEINSSDYEVVSDQIRTDIDKYNIRLFTYDANGVGAALRDWLVKPKVIDGKMFPALGIINPPTEVIKDLPKGTPKHLKICYEIKASQQKNTHMNRLLFGRFATGAIGLLEMPRYALQRLSKLKWFTDLPKSTQSRIMRPYQATDVLEQELKNLQIVDTTDGQAGQVLKVTRKNPKIQKDYFSSLQYCIAGVHQEIEIKFYSNKHKVKVSPASMVMVSKGQAPRRGRTPIKTNRRGGRY